MYYKAYTVPDYTAFQAILEDGCEDLLDDPKFADLKRFWDDLDTVILRHFVLSYNSERITI